MIVRTQSGASVHEDKGLEDFARVNDRQSQGADRNDVEANDAMFGIEPADHELFTVDALEAGSKERGGRHGSCDRQGWRCSTVLADERNPEAWQAVDIQAGRLNVLTVAVDGAGFHVVLLV